jgi:hypothetical protein
MTAIDVQLHEMQTEKLLELDEAKRSNDVVEKLKSDMEHELKQKRLELTSEHEAIVIELKAENALRIQKLKLDLRMEVSLYKPKTKLCSLSSRVNYTD